MKEVSLMELFYEISTCPKQKIQGLYELSTGEQKGSYIFINDNFEMIMNFEDSQLIISKDTMVRKCKRVDAESACKAFLNDKIISCFYKNKCITFTNTNKLGKFLISPEQFVDGYWFINNEFIDFELS